MFFEQIEQIPTLVRRSGCIVLVIPAETELKLPNALTLTPDTGKATSIISVEQIRDFIAMSSHHEVADRYFVIRPADAMNEAAQNAFLKTLEEPKPFCHFILVTEQPTALLPTILSRSQTFILRRTGVCQAPPTADAKLIALAKRLIASTPRDLPALADELASKKPKPREISLQVVETAIELLYKTYFKTNNPKFLAKLPQFIELHQNLSQNGHLKLHLVADLA